MKPSKCDLEIATKKQKKPKSKFIKLFSGELKQRFAGRMDPLLVNNQTEPWTNEKHLHFLNSMEATFVRTMLENNGRHLRLDRYLPDSSESTLDLKSQTQGRKKHTTSGI